MLNADFKEIISAFNDASVEYMVVGAYAVAAHGLPRATRDIDILTSIEAVEFDEAWPHRLQVTMDGIEMSVVKRPPELQALFDAIEATGSNASTTT